VTPYLTPLLGQGDDLTCKRLLPRNAAVKHPLGFLPHGQTAEGRKTQGDASRILALAHTMVLGHSTKRCNGIGADRQADVGEPEGLRGLQLERKRGVKLRASSGGGHGVEERWTLGQGGMRESCGFAKRLACQPP
jgi:hypothetical protein